jgi:hypothetical protein
VHQLLGHDGAGDKHADGTTDADLQEDNVLEPGEAGMRFSVAEGRMQTTSQEDGSKGAKWDCAICGGGHGFVIDAGQDMSDEKVGSFFRAVRRACAASCLQNRIGEEAYDYLCDVGLVGNG